MRMLVGHAAEIGRSRTAIRAYLSLPTNALREGSPPEFQEPSRRAAPRSAGVSIHTSGEGRQVFELLGHQGLPDVERSAHLYRSVPEATNDSRRSSIASRLAS